MSRLDKKITALIVAAGKGERFGDTPPKQYTYLGGRSVLYWSVRAFLQHPKIDHIQVVINPEHQELYRQSVYGLNLPEPVLGGASRQETVRRGLESLKALSPDCVLIHDGARPLIDPLTISRVCEALDTHKAAIAALPVTDTLKKGNCDNFVERTIPREDIWRAQTPQGFDYKTIMAAHNALKCNDGITDDASICENFGINVELVMGNAENIKITHKDDMKTAEQLFFNRLGDVRTGLGYDVHAFDPTPPENKCIRLCGVDIPFHKKLMGHSDADVGLHAITDALYGAIAMGDIGSNFPPSDPKWKGADSALFLKQAADAIAKTGGSIAHIDLTLICEAPKIGPHREKMVASICKILEIDHSRVSVKATTTEKLGFTGREEGISAQAIATVRLPVQQLDQMELNQ